MIPRRELGQLEMLQLLQELLEADENKLKVLQNPGSQFQVTVTHESVNFPYCQRSGAGGSIRQEMSRLK